MGPEAIGAIVAVIATLTGAAKYGYGKLKERVRVKRVTRSTDKDIDDFLDLYEKLFQEELRISPEELVRWIEEDRSPKDNQYYSWRHYLFICKIGGKIGGFLKCMYCTECKLMFIAYYGIDKTMISARRLATTVMMKRLIKLIQKSIKDCKAVVFELEKPLASLEKNENNERKARMRLFKEAAARRGFDFFRLDIEYLQPLMTLDRNSNSKEEILDLLYIPMVKMEKNEKLTKGQAIEILEFIYEKIYGPSYRHAPQKDKEYSAYISALIKRYKKELPRYVKLEKL